MNTNNPIGFKPDTTNALLKEQISIEGQKIEEMELDKLQAILTIADILDKKMRSFSKSIIADRSFSEYTMEEFKVKFDKLYTKYYEPI